MIDVGELDGITDNYGEDVYQLCNNAVAWMIIKLQGTSDYYCAEVCRGEFEGRDHTWMKFNGYYIDLTLAQFIEAPRIAITRVTEKNGYAPYKTMAIPEFLEMLKNEV